jgi:hypothetical protein
MLPIIALTDHFRQRGQQFRYGLPHGGPTAQFFQRTNWSHLLDPQAHDTSDSASNNHFAASRYADSHDQTRLVNRTLDCVLRKSPDTSDSALNAIRWSLSEIMDNVLVHSEASLGGLMQVEVMRDKVAFCVVDCGSGIQKTLSQTYPQLKTDSEAIEFAVRAGVTRNASIGQGNGLAGSLNLAIAFNGQFGVTSGDSRVLWHPGVSSSSAYVDRSIGYRFPGTIVDLQIQRDLSRDLGPLIASLPETAYTPADYLEDKFLSDDLRSMHVVLRDETFGFGTRSAGEGLRNLVLRLLRQPSHPAVFLDWDGVPLIASSFADEFLGKLFIELGPLAFMSRVKLINLSPLVASLINKAISQRAQHPHLDQTDD